MNKRIMAAFVLMGGLGVAGCDLATGEFDAERFQRGMESFSKYSAAQQKMHDESLRRQAEYHRQNPQQIQPPAATGVVQPAGHRNECPGRWEKTGGYTNPGPWVCR
jgi:hypothetical protein